MQKADLFVCSPKNRDATLGVITGPIHVKLMRALRHRLSEKGFTDVTVDTMLTPADPMIATDEIKVLKDNPIYLTEHWLSKPIIIDPNMHSKITGIYTAPYRMRPDIGEYRYCHNGQPPLLHFAFIGNINSGKTYVMHEFCAMLTELCGEVNFVKCRNEWDHPESVDLTIDPEFMAIYREHIKGNTVILGNGPSYRVNMNNVVESNTRL